MSAKRFKNMREVDDYLEKQIQNERFTWKTEKLQHSDDEVLLVVDKENKDWKGHILNIVDLLNKQQATITALKEENIELKKLRKYCAEWIGVKEENLYDVVR